MRKRLGMNKRANSDKNAYTFRCFVLLSSVHFELNILDSLLDSHDDFFEFDAAGMKEC